ncbi:hypothetical protein [Peptostreptococcus faecalis]|uniref:hypothetical protein n=1 Tax=Peptostreptococcus faecalis TaxID=2045015 RepID=UPI0015E14CC7|nr:hypothetical protein [Peptostreptococcus faecalis]
MEFNKDMYIEVLQSQVNSFLDEKLKLITMYEAEKRKRLELEEIIENNKKIEQEA